MTTDPLVGEPPHYSDADAVIADHLGRVSVAAVRDMEHRTGDAVVAPGLAAASAVLRGLSSLGTTWLSARLVRIAERLDVGEDLPRNAIDLADVANVARAFLDAYDGNPFEPDATAAELADALHQVTAGTRRGGLL